MLICPKCKPFAKVTCNPPFFCPPRSQRRFAHRIGKPKATHGSVPVGLSGSEIRRENQLIMVLYPMIYMVLGTIPGGWPWDFWTIKSMSLKYRLLMRKCSSSQPISPMKMGEVFCWCLWLVSCCFVVDWLGAALILGGSNFFVFLGVVHICLDLPACPVGWFFGVMGNKMTCLVLIPFRAMWFLRGIAWKHMFFLEEGFFYKRHQW